MTAERPMGAIPEAMRQAKRWLCWRTEEDSKGRPTKVPYRAWKSGLSHASSIDAATWTSYDVAVAAVAANEKLDGIGFALGDGWAGIDLDHCMSEDGEPARWAEDVLALFDSYTEVSVSGLGLHIIVRGALPEGYRNQTPMGDDGKLEAYDEKRYFTVSGAVYCDRASVEEQTEQLAEFARRYLPQEAPKPQPAPAPVVVEDAADLLEKARQSKHGAEFSALYDRGDLSNHAGDASSADLALTNYLAYWFGDPVQIDNAFRGSALMRKKWDEKRGGQTYGQLTIAKALAGRTDYYTPAKPRATAAPVPSSVDTQAPKHEQPDDNGFALVPPSEDEPADKWRTHAGAARNFAREHKGGLLYVDAKKTWFLYNSAEGRWVPDETCVVQKLAIDMARRRLLEAVGAPIVDEDEVKFALQLERRANVRDVLALAQSFLPARASEFDTDPWRINCPNGVLDLRTGKLERHSPEDRFTAMTACPYVEDARSDLWEAFLERVTGGDKDLQRFLAQVAGYALSGSTEEEKLFFVHGPTRSGKSTFLSALQATFGPEYAMSADFETFLAGRRPDASGPKEHVASLAGKHLVVSVETSEGNKFAEGLVKQLTGGEYSIRARFLHGNSFEFRPMFTLFLAANDRPKARAEDDALWERIVEVPFPTTIPEGERDPNVKKRLSRDPECLAAILVWTVRGCLDWQQNGLIIPEVAKAATASYRASQEPLTEFVEDRCTLDEREWATKASIWEAYIAWVKDQGIRHPLTRTAFGRALERMGCEQTKDRGIRGWLGICLRAENAEEPDLYA